MISKFLPEHAEGIKRESLIQTCDFINYIIDFHTEVYEKAVKKLGKKECRDAFSDLSKHVELWR